MKFYKIIKVLLPTITDLASHLTYSPNQRESQYQNITKFFALAFGIACAKNTLRAIMLFLAQERMKIYFSEGKIPKSQNTLAAFTTTLDPMEIRQFAYRHFKVLWRKKRFTPFALQNGQYVISLDGVETHHSKEKSCDNCLIRTHKKGTPEEWIEYYHREVVLTIVGPSGSFFIDAETISPKYSETGKDSETTAAKRLLARLHENKILKYFSILVVDALYAKATFIQLVESYNLIPVIRIKQENYNIIKDVNVLKENVKFSKKYVDNQKDLEYQYREFNNLTSWASYPGTLRIVEIKGKYFKKKKNKNYHAYWVMPMERSLSLSMELIRIIGHLRWKEELNTFRSLKQNFEIQHTTHHHPVSISIVFLLKCLFHAILSLYLIRKLNPFSNKRYLLKDLLDFIKTNVLIAKRSLIKGILDTI